MLVASVMLQDVASVVVERTRVDNVLDPASVRAPDCCPLEIRAQSFYVIFSSS